MSTWQMAIKMERICPRHIAGVYFVTYFANSSEAMSISCICYDNWLIMMQIQEEANATAWRWTLCEVNWNKVPSVWNLVCHVFVAGIVVAGRCTCNQQIVDSTPGHPHCWVPTLNKSFTRVQCLWSYDCIMAL